jgi:IS30 family transposase
MKGVPAMPNQKHLTLDDRNYIHSGLNTGLSFRQIAHRLDKDPSTISKEVRLHRISLATGAVGRIPNKCIHRTECTIGGLCDDPTCQRDFCRYCRKCNSKCPDFLEEHCFRLSRPPYVCNGCDLLHRCILTKYVYRALSADRDYRTNLATSRTGLSYAAEELLYLDEILTPLVRKQQSIHHICITQADNIICSERTVYKLIEQGVLTVRNIDLPRKIRYRPRRQSNPFKVDKSCRIGRTYQDFQAYMKEHPDTSVVQMDSVEGCKGGKVLLTIFFTQSDLLLMYLRDRNTSQSVIDIFNDLFEVLGRETFQRLFPVLLGDNGSEFSNPLAIEYDAAGLMRTRLFYCDPSSPHQKPEIERSHEFIRMVLPKGKSFNSLTQGDVNVLACHTIPDKEKAERPHTLAAFSFFTWRLFSGKLGLQQSAG